MATQCGNHGGNQAVPGAQAIPGVRRIIAVASGKGGVGKSTVAVNLAVALADMGSKVGLLDADIYGPSIPNLLGSNERPKISGEKIVPIHAHGVSMMSLGNILGARRPVIWRGPMVHGALQQFIVDVEWGELDYLIVDLPPGTGDAQLTLCQTVPLAGVVIVTTPQDLAAEIASNALVMFREMEVPVLGIIENMGTFVCPHCGTESAIFSEGGAERAGYVLGAPVLGSVPLDPSVCIDGDQGVPTVLSHPDSAAARALRSIAEQTAARANEMETSEEARTEALGGAEPHAPTEEPTEEAASGATVKPDDRIETPADETRPPVMERNGMKEKIEEALATIRPHLQMDGGDVEFVSYEDGVVKVRLKGACAGCPMSQMTLTMGVEKVLKEKIPEITKVEAVD